MLERMQRVVPKLRAYHNHTVRGLENIPLEGPALLVINHSLATYDGVLLASVIYEAQGRIGGALGDKLIFKIPGLGPAARRMGIRPGTAQDGRSMLEAGHLVFVAPGGMREALRPSEERYRVRWSKRQGFIRLALKSQVPIIPIGCPAADDLYTVYENRFTKAAYKRFKLPLPVIRGVGFSLKPRPVTLTHHVGEPIVPPVMDPDRFVEQVDALHTRAVDAMSALLQRS